MSKKRYFCKYCDIYIADDAPSRQQHENGLRHKGNVDRFIRGLYKGSEKRKKDLDEEKRDMAKVELASRPSILTMLDYLTLLQAAQAAYAQDVASGHARTMAAPVASTSSTSRKPPPKPSNPYAHYSTAASLGYSDPDAERFAAETERRRTQGLAGDWEVVTSTSGTSAETSEPAAGSTLKRNAENAVDFEDVREFKLRKKTVNIGLGEIYDPGIIAVKPKKEVTPPPEVTGVPSIKTETQNWTPVQWGPSSAVATEHGGAPSSAEGSDLAQNPVVKAKDDSAATVAPVDDPALADFARDASTNILTAKPEEVEIPTFSTADSSGSMFRKRKSRPNGNRGRTQ